MSRQEEIEHLERQLFDSEELSPEVTSRLKAKLWNLYEQRKETSKK